MSKIVHREYIYKTVGVYEKRKNFQPKKTPLKFDKSTPPLYTLYTLNNQKAVCTCYPPFDTLYSLGVYMISYTILSTRTGGMIDKKLPFGSFLVHPESVCLLFLRRMLMRSMMCFVLMMWSMLLVDMVFLKVVCCSLSPVFFYMMTGNRSEHHHSYNS